MAPSHTTEQDFGRDELPGSGSTAALPLELLQQEHTPGLAGDLGQAVVREQAKATVQWNEMLEENPERPAPDLQGTGGALVDRLSPGPDGTRKKQVGVDRLLEFLGTFSKKDVADDEQLRVLVAEVRGLLSGQDVSRLRKDQGCASWYRSGCRA